MKIITNNMKINLHFNCHILTIDNANVTEILLDL